MMSYEKSSWLSLCELNSFNKKRVEMFICYCEAYLAIVSDFNQNRLAKLFLESLTFNYLKTI